LAAAPSIWIASALDVRSIVGGQEHRQPRRVVGLACAAHRTERDHPRG
jgi:hypothetical protein